MASVTGMTVAEIERQLDDMVIEVRISVSTGHLIYKRRSGAEIDGGALTNAALAADKAWPVDSIFISAVPTNPNTLLGVGTWVRFAKGRTLVGLDEAQTEFDSTGETGGVKEVTLTSAQIPAHTHPIPLHFHGIPPHTHQVYVGWGGTDTSGSTGLRVSNVGGQAAGASVPSGSGYGVTESDSGTRQTDNNTNGDVTSNNTGGGGAHTNLPPYIVVYMWKRTA